MNINYRQALEKELLTVENSGKTPKLLLHGCCAPCGSYVLEYLSHYFDITVLYFNPNIYPREEYDKRARELEKLLTAAEYPASLLMGEYDEEVFERFAAPFGGEPEGGKRCEMCFAFRLEETAKHAGAGCYDYFSTTLSVSPHKNAGILNKLGGEFAEKYRVKYLFSDFKKNDGYKRSIVLSERYGLYRQTYCGCKYSLDSKTPARLSLQPE